MIPLVIIRPEPGAQATLRAALDTGLNAQAFPLFTVRPLSWEPVPRGGIDALLLGSANALRHAGDALSAYRGLPVYAVGKTTARAAEEAGLKIAAAGSGDLQSLLPMVAPAHRRLLRLTGREHVALELPPGLTVQSREVYASDPLPMPPGLAGLLRSSAVVVLHSGEAAAHFARECDARAIGRDRIMLAAIGPRVAERAGGGWAALDSAQSPSDAALLALAGKMCQDPARCSNRQR